MTAPEEAMPDPGALDWCIKPLGITKANLVERYHKAWIVLALSGPGQWLRFLGVVYVFGYGTGWHPMYYPSMLIQAVAAVTMIWSLRYNTLVWNSFVPVKYWNFVVATSGYLELILPLPGFISPIFLWMVPFRNATAVMIYYYLAFPLLLVIGHVGNPKMCNTNAGMSLLSMVFFHSSNGLRLVDPVADIILGIRMFIAAARGLCTYDGGSNCTAFLLVGSVVSAASAVDFILSLVMSQFFDYFLPNLAFYTRKAILEGCMLICELSIFICSILILIHGMANSENLEGYEDMRAYTVLCSVSTFTAFAITLLLIFVPSKWWETLDKIGVSGIVMNAGRKRKIFSSASVAPLEPPIHKNEQPDTDEGCASTAVALTASGQE